MKLLLILLILLTSCEKKEPAMLMQATQKPKTKLSVEEKSYDHIIYKWDPLSKESLAKRFEPHPEYTRVKCEKDSFGEWLRFLPLRPEGTKVRMFNKALKGNQTLHAAVIDIDTGDKNLQQCADAIMRLRSEYLLSIGKLPSISFNFTSGHAARWTDWMRGLRPVVRGNSVSWKAKAKRDTSYAQFRSYLNTVFMYAGTLSLAKEVKRTNDPKPGDIFIQGGSPGHAVIILDVCENKDGQKMLLLAQSYMPAQDMHILKNMNEPQLGVWHRWNPGQNFPTAEWKFKSSDLRKF